jgi:DNA-binding GntR family transcriptional regulator
MVSMGRRREQALGDDKPTCEISQHAWFRHIFWPEQSPKEAYVARRKPKLRIVAKADPAMPPRRNRVNLFEIAYQRLEELLVNGGLRPGRFLSMQDLQDMTGLGRTPIHHAVNRLAADTLIIIKPRHGLQIAPIDLARERLLLQLRRDVERFVVRLAAERSGPSQRNQMLHMERVLREKRQTLTLAQFNEIDRKMDKLILAAASEPFLENTLRPLHTIFRRIGYIHHSHIQGRANLSGTIGHHLAVLTAVANRHVDEAVAASDALMGFMDGMFDVMEAEIDPTLLDCSVEPLLIGTGGTERVR